MEHFEPSVRSGMWLQREVREAVRRHAIELLSSRGRPAAEAIAAKLDTAWRGALASRDLGPFLDRVDALPVRRSAPRATATHAEETPEAKLSWLRTGRPPPVMNWPSWAPQPWLDRPLQDVVDEHRDKWRRVDRGQQFSRVVKVSDEVRALAEDSARSVMARLHDDDFVEEPPELLDLEHLLDQSAPADPPPTATGSLATGAPPSFLTGDSRQRVEAWRASPAAQNVRLAGRDLDEGLFLDEVDLGPDADVTDPIDASGWTQVHARFASARVSYQRREHCIVLPRALVVVKGELRVLYNCRLRMPFTWRDATDPAPVKDKSNLRQEGLQQQQHVDDDPRARLLAALQAADGPTTMDNDHLAGLDVASLVDFLHET